MKSNYTKILSAMMALLGFPACDREPTELYASPSIDYEVKGKVTAGSVTGEPIPGIRVIWQPHTLEELGDTVYTDKQGEFSFRNTYSFDTRIIAEDIDGDANGGSFMRDTVDLDVSIINSADKKGKLYQVNFYLQKEEGKPDNDETT